MAGCIKGSLYFSVVTITTLGYGDITPVHPWARATVMLEAVIGPLYLAILVARLVSLGIENSGSHGLLTTGQIGTGRTLPTISLAAIAATGRRVQGFRKWPIIHIPW